MWDIRSHFQIDSNRLLSGMPGVIRFDPDLRAFCYARVLEIPTPRWTALMMGVMEKGFNAGDHGKGL